MVQLRASIKISLLLLAVIFLLNGCSSIPVISGSTTDESKKIKSLSGKSGVAFDLAVNALASGQYQQAVAGFKQVINIKPRLAAPYINLAISYRHLYEFENAMAAIHQALQNAPDSSEAYNVQGIIQRESGLFKEARKSYLKSIKLNNNTDAYLNMAILCDLYLQDLTCALENYESLQVLEKSENKKLQGWIIDLKRRMKKGSIS